MKKCISELAVDWNFEELMEHVGSCGIGTPKG